MTSVMAFIHGVLQQMLKTFRKHCVGENQRCFANFEMVVRDDDTKQEERSESKFNTFGKPVDTGADSEHDAAKNLSYTLTEVGLGIHLDWLRINPRLQLPRLR